jgi:hypothetical protein
VLIISVHTCNRNGCQWWDDLRLRPATPADAAVKPPSAPGFGVMEKWSSRSLYIPAYIHGYYIYTTQSTPRLSPYRMAKDFLGESRLALEYRLRYFGGVQPPWTAESILRVGHWLTNVPKWYGFNLAGRILSDDQVGTLAWAHLAQLSRLAEVGPAVVPRPKLIPWIGPREGKNERLTKKHDAAVLANRELWHRIVSDIKAVASATTERPWTPQQLERQVNLRLGRRPRGRPQKRVIDPDAPITISDVPIR